MSYKQDSPALVRRRASSLDFAACFARLNSLGLRRGRTLIELRHVLGTPTALDTIDPVSPEASRSFGADYHGAVELIGAVNLSSPSPFVRAT